MNTPAEAPPATIPGRQEELLAEIGHELRSPLSSILAFADALNDEVFGPLNPAQKKSLTTIRECVQRQNRNIAELIDLRKFECGLHTLTMGPCPVAEAMAKAVASQAELTQSRKVQLVSEVIPPSLVVRADPQRFDQLASQLLKAGLSAADKEAAVSFTIHDGGPPHGLCLTVIVAQPDVAMDSLALPTTTQTDSAIEQRLCKLSPIGFSLVRHIIAAHGGSLACWETPEGTLCLSAHLPQALV